MKIKIDEGARVPTRAHPTDAGLDLYATHDAVVPWNGSAIIQTGVHVQLPEGMAGLLVSKSGLSIKKDITSTGLIDEGFQGEILVKLYNHGFKSYQVKKGDKVSQLVVFPVQYPSVEIVDEFAEKTERGENGYGSTGR